MDLLNSQEAYYQYNNGDMIPYRLKIDICKEIVCFIAVNTEKKEFF